MTLPVFLTIVIAIVLLLVATLFLFMPQMIPAVEEKLNTAWGDQKIISISLGTSGEDEVETLLNKPILSKTIYWDNWAKKNPRATGIMLYGCVVMLLIMVPIF